MKSRIADSETPALPSPSGAVTSPGVVSRRNILQAFWRHRWWIVLCTIFGVVGGYVYMKKQVRIFSAYSRIYIQENAPNVLGASGIETQTGIATQIEVIRCTPLLTAVAERPEVKELGFIKTAPNPVNAIKGGLNVFSPGAPDILTIVFESQNPVEAAVMVNAVVDAYVDFTTKEKKSTADEALETLTKERKKVEDELQQSVKAETDFQRDHGSLSFTDEGKGNIILQRLARLSDMVTTAQLEAIDAKSQYQTIMALKDQPKRLLELARNEMPRDTKDVSFNMDPRGIQQQEDDRRLAARSQSLGEEVDKGERALARLLLSHTPEHIAVKEAEADLALTRKQLAANEARIAADKKMQLDEQRQDAELARKIQASREQGRQQEADQQMVEGYLARVTRRYAMAQQRQTSLDEILGEQQKQAMDLNVQAANYAALASEHRRRLNMYELLANRIQGINVNEDTRRKVTVNILDVAKPVYSPIRPDKPRIMGMGLILGIAIGCGLAFGLDVMDERFHSADEVMAALDVPLLGIIPHIVDKEQQKFRGRHVALEPMSDVAEAYRTIRTAIYFAIRNEGAKRLLVTSPAPGDGKTTTTTNIAIAMAQAGRRVLLIDADFRKPTVHKIFQLSAEVGVTSIMLGEVSRERAIQASSVENLDILPCGPLPSNPAEILNGQAFLDLLEGLDRMYDHIIIDSPPVVPVTDARILGALCDDTILVLRAEKSTRRLSEHACESLLSVGTRILGVVVNDVPRRRDGYGYYYGYGYGYRYYQYGYGPKSGHKGKIPTNGNGNGNGNGHGNGNGNGASDVKSLEAGVDPNSLAPRLKA